MGMVHPVDLLFELLTCGRLYLRVDRVHEAPDEDERRRHDHLGGVIHALVERVLLGDRHRHHAWREQRNRQTVTQAGEGEASLEWKHCSVCC